MVVSFEEYDNRAEKLKKYKERILKLIDEFVELENIYQGYGKYDNSFDFYINRKGYFIIQHYFSGKDVSYATNELRLSEEQYKKLKKFMKNPDLYKSIKKYNL